MYVGSATTVKHEDTAIYRHDQNVSALHDVLWGCDCRKWWTVAETADTARKQWRLWENAYVACRRHVRARRLDVSVKLLRRRGSPSPTDRGHVTD